MLTARTLRGFRRPVSRNLTWATCFALLIVSILAAGCGKGGEAANSVSGKVTLDGEAVSGNVTFVGADNKEVSAPTNAANGEYKIDNPPIGQVKILVKALPGAITTGPPVKDAPVMGGKTGVPPPAKYAAPSDLTYEVKPGKHTYNIELKK